MSLKQLEKTRLHILFLFALSSPPRSTAWGWPLRHEEKLVLESFFNAFVRRPCVVREIDGRIRLLYVSGCHSGCGIRLTALSRSSHAATISLDQSRWENVS